VIRRRPLVVVAASGIALLVIGFAIGATGPASEIDRLKDERAELTRERDAAASDKATLSAGFDDVQGELDEANEKLAAIGDLRARKRELSREISRLEGRVRDERAKLVVAQDQVAKSTITDGTWQLNVDYVPGTYKAEGGDACYWEKLSGPSGDGIDGIIENGGFSPNQIVSIDSPYFKTTDCGTWTRTG